MPDIDVDRERITARVLYYGPGLSGKSTNFYYVRDHMSKNRQGQMRLLNARKADRKVIELLPLHMDSLKGFDLTYHLCTVPGKASLYKIRRSALRNTDGVIFVADSRKKRELANRDSMQDLEENLRANNLRLEDMPHVLQYNQRDRPDIFSVAKLRSMLNKHGVREFEAIATIGQGVMETLFALFRLVREDISRRI
ncbi:MAG: GTP-binding protein [Candidatus Brocadiia bacterium]